MDYTFDDIKNGSFIIQSYVETTNQLGVVEKLNFRAKMTHTGGSAYDVNNWKMEDFTPL